MKLIDRSIARIRAYAVHMGWSKSRYAREANVNDTTLRKFHDKDWSPTADTLRDLEAIIPPEFQPPMGDDDQKGEGGPQPIGSPISNASSSSCSDVSKTSTANDVPPPQVAA